MSILLLRRFNPFSTRPTLDEIAGEIPETEVDIVGVLPAVTDWCCSECGTDFG